MTRILLAEDEAMSAMLLTRCLQINNHQVCASVATGEQAIERCGVERPDVVLMDVRLAGKPDGIETALEIYRRYQIPAVFMTGYSCWQVADRIQDAMLYRCLEKPIQPDDLEAAIEQLLGAPVESVWRARIHIPLAFLPGGGVKEPGQRPDDCRVCCRIQTERYMTLDRKFRALRDKGTADFSGAALRHEHQGVSKDRIRVVLERIDHSKPDMIDAVFALLDDVTPSMFSKAPSGTKFNTGATTAHIGSHVGILQRGGNKLDREGRDLWIKPLRELGAIELVYFDPAGREFIPGHPVPKSPNSAYRLADSFVAILKADEAKWPALLADWISKEKARERASLQAALAEQSRSRVDTRHSDLIQTGAREYAPRFLSGYHVIFTDAADGERITSQETGLLTEARVAISLDDAMPDLLLWNPVTDWLWVIEAVTSDGEVDLHKASQLKEMAARNGKPGIGFTTIYRTWKDAARRQGAHKNIAPDTYVWIAEDPSKHFHAIEMDSLISNGSIELT